MLKMHVPYGAVRAKMAAEGLGVALLDAPEPAASPAPPRAARSSPTPRAVDVAAPAVVRRGPPPGCERKPRVKTRRVYLDYASDDDALASGDWWRGFDAPLRSEASADLEDVFGLAAVRRDGFRDADAARLLAPSLDAPSALFAVVACGVPRCAAKVGYLWLEATYADRCAELVDGGVAPLKTAANQLAGSYGLRDVLRTALGVANFANHGTARAQRPGVRTSALGKLREARARGGGGAESANLLQYVARHARVKPRRRRDALAEELRALTAERHGADAERERLAAEAPRSRTSPRRVARVVATSASTSAPPAPFFFFFPARGARARSPRFF
ncbi:hypothetical protein JL720_3899 [Aureococcus anophagefferens]|nr:hypothetical protein JL720_3899 [Aureococcus anophagefferens]